MDFVTRCAALLDQGEAFCLVTAVASNLPEVAVGAKLLVRRDGTAEGSLGDGAADGEAVTAARSALRERRRGLAELSGGVRAFLDVLEAEARVVVCGAGHIALPLARMCREVGFAVTVLDDRPDFASPERFPGCEVLAEPFVPTLRALALGPSTYVVVITRGHEHDAECLGEVLRKETAYVGLIGSRRRVGFVLEELGRGGIPQERLADVFAPIGLPLGAESPGEIALSIAAQLVAVRRRGRALEAAGRGAR